MPAELVYPFAFLFGALWGSFLNVCIVRLPEGRSVVAPRSSCPSCGAPIAGYDNIPIVSYLVLRGRCRACKAKFSPRYLMIELLMAMVTLAIVHVFGVSWTSLAYFLLAMGLVVATFVDLQHGYIPNEVSYSLILVGLGSSLVPDATVRPMDAFLGAAAGGGGLLLVAVIYRFVRKGHGVGYGDIKLLFGIGAFIGWKALPILIFLASAQGVLVAGIAYVRRRGEPLTLWSAQGSGDGSEPAEEDDEGPPAGKFAVPFGPFLALATLEVIFFGPAIARAVFGTVLW